MNITKEMRTKTVSELRNELIRFIKVRKITSKYMNLNMNRVPYTKGFGFFPYGNGLSDISSTQIPQGCIVIAGQDFGTIEYVENSKFKEYGEAEKNTMKALKKLTQQNSQDYFFTNVFIGLRNDKKMIGKNPGLKFKEDNYLDASFDFFKRQLEILQPRAVVILGSVPYNFICSKMEKPSFKITTFSNYFLDKKVIQHNNIDIICIPHPSMWNSNVKDLSVLINFFNSYVL